MAWRLFCGFLVLLSLVLVLLIAFGSMASLHGAADSVAVFRAQLCGLLLGMACLAAGVGIRRFAFVSALISAIAGVPLIHAYLQDGVAGHLTLYQKNLLFRNDDLAGLAADITAANPDFITLQEVSDRNLALLATLAPAYPTQHFCPFRGVGGTAVLSAFSAVPGSATCAHGLSAVQVETDAGPVWLISVHLHWPWPYGQAKQVEDLVPAIAALRGPKIIGGDFNMVPWSRNMARIAAAGRVQFAGPTRGTYPQFGPLLTLPIDHVLTPAGGITTLRPLLGSDHLGLLVRFDLA